jgi:3-oxoacyl-[acyl-carrier protein] reductase
MKTIIITGSSSGIGSYLVDHYLSSGWRVVCGSRGEHKINNNGMAFIDVGLDICSEESVNIFFKRLSDLKIVPDALVNCAGIASMNHFLLTPTNTIKKIVDTNFLGTLMMCKGFAKATQKGRIVNFSSVGVNLNLEGETAYVCSKAAVEQLTKNLAKELAPITVNCVSPNLIRTNLIKGFDESKLDKIINLQAIKRFGKFEDVSNVIDFFISSKSDMITGQVITLGGVL